MVEGKMPLFRSLLFAPANNSRRVEKALSLAADAVILDLEDACPVSEKVASRALAREALTAPRRSAGFVRINALSTEFGYGDLVALLGPGVDGVVLPKVECSEDVKLADWLLTQLEREHSLPNGSIELIPLIETARGVAEINAIARSGGRLRRIAFGAADFTVDLGAQWTADELELLFARNALTVASRAAGLEPPIDTPWIALNDEAGFRASATRARQLGFQGKLCIHPNQLAVVNQAFSPTDQEIARAAKIVRAFSEAETAGLAAVSVDGAFVDYPIFEQARRILSLADRIAAPEAPRST